MLIDLFVYGLMASVVLAVFVAPVLALVCYIVR